MSRVVIVGKIHSDGLTVLQHRHDLVLDQLDDATEAEVAAAARGADAILIRTSRLSAAAIGGAPHLKVVSRHGVGYDNIDVETLTARRIPLAVVGAINAVSVAEHAFFMLLATMKHGFAYDRAVRRGAWGFRNSLAARELAGKTLLIVGYGRIGREVAQRALAFGMRVIACDPYVNGPPEGTAVQLIADLDAVLPEADAVTLHVPLTSATRLLFDRARLARMKPSSVLICTARGDLIDEAALAEALAGGRLAAAGIDVFAEEPPPADHPLFALDNVVLSPHSAALTQECAARMSAVAAQNCLDGLDGRLDPALVVNREILGVHP
ncbi:MAG: D-3-phosphoglycerate dehydrogenase / 2-oxoglutarate reductase [Rhodospirillaceae bacterium]|jgi:D-3-phosphoglycerate dehydrogenase|nr:D-3-phosphoglycerate dehydrogenase / 2-oxoglutarate reductase [Rhodospirillaceae bacterium]